MQLVFVPKKQGKWLLNNSVRRVYVWVHVFCVYVLEMLKFTSALSFLGRFCFCLLWLIEIGEGFQTQHKIHWSCKFMRFFFQKLMKMLHFTLDFDSACIIWWGLLRITKLHHRILTFIDVCKFLKNHVNYCFVFSTLRSGMPVHRSTHLVGHILRTA